MLIGTAVFLSLIVLLLAMPVTQTYQLSWRQSLSAWLRLIWAFGLVRADVSPDTAKASADSPERKPGKAVGRRSARGRRIHFMRAIRLPAFRRRVLRFLADVWDGIHKKNVQLQVRLGLGDPSDTGRLWAVLGPLSAMLAHNDDVRITIEPDFLDATLDVDSSGTIRVVPIQLVIVALGLCVSPPFWRGVMLMRGTR